MRVRDRGFFFVLEAHLFPRTRFSQQCPQQLVVQLVARLVAVERADEAVSQEIQIADCVEDLVFDELVLVAQTNFVQNSVVVQHDRVVHRSAEREVLFAQHFDVAHEA